MRTLGTAVALTLFASFARAQYSPDAAPTKLPPLAPPTPARLANEAPARPGPIAAALGAPMMPSTLAAADGTRSVPAALEDDLSDDLRVAAPSDPLISCDDLAGISGCKIPSRWSVRHDVGDGVGFTRGFTYVEGFVPVWQPTDASVVYGDGRVVNFDDADRWEFNIGGGWRTHAPEADAVLGLNVFYDGRHTDTNFFHQIGVGAEALFPRVDLRCNGYIIVGPSNKLAAETPFMTMTVGDQLIVARLLTFDVAMGGVDFEAGAMLPAVGPVAPRVFLGGYHYSAHGAPSVNGVRGRFEAWIGRNVTLHCAVQHDDVFDTTVSGGAALHFGGGEVRRAAANDPPRGVTERLAQRVVRDVDVVVAQTSAWQGHVVHLPKPPKGVDGAGEEAPPPPPPPGGSGEEPKEEEPPKEEPPCPPPPPVCPPPPPVVDCPPPPCPPKPKEPDCSPKPKDADCPPPSCLPPECRPCPPIICRPAPRRPDCFPGRGRGHDRDRDCDDDRRGRGHDCDDHRRGRGHDCDDDRRGRGHDCDDDDDDDRECGRGRPYFCFPSHGRPRCDD